jgi:hypothetical protein
LPIACHNQNSEINGLSCAICEQSREKRFCPALHGRICPQCCGEQREVTLDCPSDCIYLQRARQHEKPRPLEVLDQRALFPSVELGDQFLYQQEHLVLGLSYSLAKGAKSDHGIRDMDLIAALTALARSYETLESSRLHYEVPLTNIKHQAIASELEKMVKEYREAEQKHTGYSRLRDADVLRALVFLIRLAFTRTSGRPRSRAFVDFLLLQFPEPRSVITLADEG